MMDDDERDSNASSDNDGDDVMEDANDDINDDNNDDDGAEDRDGENDGNDDNDENDDGQDNEVVETQGSATAADSGRQATPAKTSPTPIPASIPVSRFTVRPEFFNARLYDIVPTMAAPQSTSINALAVTPDQRFWMTGGSDGYVRKYDGPGTINGKQLLTVAQRHAFVDSVVKAGILMSYWENEEAPSTVGGRNVDDHVLSPVYSLAIHSGALWLLSGLESGGINLQSVRHDEGKRIHCLQKHTNAVSVLTLAPDEMSVLSGSWDKNIFDWDLNTGDVSRSFDGTGGQLSAIELRPARGDPIPVDAGDEFGGPQSDTFSSNYDKPLANGHLSANNDAGDRAGDAGGEAIGDGQRSPSQTSYLGSDHASLFGDVGGGFEADDDDEFSGGVLTGDDGGGQTDNLSGETSTALQASTSAQGAGEDISMGGSDDIVKKESPQIASEISGGLASTGATAPLETQQGSAQNTTAPATSTGGTAMERSEMSAAATGEVSQSTQSPRPAPSSPTLVVKSEPPPSHMDVTQVSESTFFSAAIDGTIRIWDRRIQDPVARITPKLGVPPWCMGACWSHDGNWIYAGRRNGTVEEFNIHKARSRWEPERALKFPAGSGPVSAVRPMVNGRHLVCASHDILRLYDLRDQAAFRHSTVPFLIIPGPPRAGVISSLYVDPTSRFMLSAAGTRGWEGSSTEVLIGYEIHPVAEDAIK